MKSEGALVGSVARWPLRGIEKLRVSLTALAHIVGSKIHNSPRMPQRNVDVHGNNLTADPSMTTCFSSWPLISSGSVQNTSLRRRTTSRPPASLRTFSSPYSGLRQPTKCCFKLINGILPDFVIDARGPRFSELLGFMDSSRLDGVETLADIKGLGIGESSGAPPYSG